MTGDLFILQEPLLIYTISVNEVSIHLADFGLPQADLKAL